MRPAPKRRAIDHVVPRLGPDRVARMWSAIDAPPKPRRTPLYVALAVACALVVWGTRSKDAPLASGDLVTTKQTPTALRLPDGSELRASASTELQVVRAEPDEVELSLTQGSLRCEVSHVPRRRFAVRAGDITVLVRGTIFTVDAREDGLRVSVERGLVEVRRADALLASLSAGQSWTEAPQVQPPEPAPQAAVPEPSAAPKPRKREARKAEPAPDGAQLLERASRARMEGDPRAAASLYEQLYREHARDPRAGLAAFELARIAVHTLREPTRALAALTFARTQRQGFARDDADALEIEALAQAHDVAGCEAARARFVAQHPESAHRARVEHACPER